MGDTIDNISMFDDAISSMNKSDLIRLRASILDEKINFLEDKINAEKSKRDLLYKVGTCSIVGGTAFAVLSAAYCALTNQSADTSTLLFCNSSFTTGFSFAALAVAGIAKNEKIGKLRNARKYATHLRKDCDEVLNMDDVNSQLHIYDGVNYDEVKKYVMEKKIESEFKKHGFNISEKPKTYIKKKNKELK